MDLLFGHRALRETFWALKDVNFEIARGDNLGLIGPNGSGKSTLLKILANIYKPTTGRVRIAGRVIPFLELGLGLLESEQTGRDNIYYAGILFGLSRREVEEVFDDVVKFAGLEQYLHTPLKYYSTGMQIRLTFAIALFCRPEIFLVDEILAVGDIAFRRKCYDALKGLKRQEETLVFVSHDLQALKEFFDHGLLLLNGQVRVEGDIDQIIEEYMFGAWTRPPTSAIEGSSLLKAVDILDVKIRDSQGRERYSFRPWEPVDVCIDFRVNDDIRPLLLHVQATGEDGEYYFGTRTVLNGPDMPVEGHKTRATLSVPHIPLLQGKILFTISAMNSSMTKVFDRREKQDYFWIANTTTSEGKVDFHPEWRFG
jgi:lipopolysaccharide transport system ATP-binding protein